MIPGLIINTIGVFLGAILAFFTVRWQMSNQGKRMLQKNNELLCIHLERIKLELRDNRNTVNQLIETLENSNHSRRDIWEWGKTIVDAFSNQAHDDFLKSGIQRNLPVHIEKDTFYSYKKIEGLEHMVKQSSAGHDFVMGYSGDEVKADQLFNNTKTYARTVSEYLEMTTKVIYEYYDKVEKQQR